MTTPSLSPTRPPQGSWGDDRSPARATTWPHLGPAGAAEGWWAVSPAVLVAAVVAFAAVALAAASLPRLPAPMAVALLGAAGVLCASALLPAAARAGGPAAADAEAARLAERNELLHVVHELSRSLPTNQDLDEVLVAIRAQLQQRFGAERLAVLTLEEDRWYPELVDGLDLGSATVLDALPAPLDRALLAPSVLRIDDLSAVSDRSGSGLYARLIVDGAEAGLLVVEHPEPARFDDGAVELFDAVGEVVALAIDNARSFCQLRSLAAAEERGRIARDLHDRLGQWLTYIGLELERINGGLQPPDAQLERLQGDVRAAIDELRDALVELRTTIRAERPLSLVLPEVVGRFAERTGLRVELAVPDDPAARLSAVVEGELLRIAQESLTNIEKHADATTVHINWSIDGGRGILTIGDDGRGFDPGRGIRSTAYGLVGMRERAAAVGAILEIASQRGTGTAITVLAGTTEENRP